jgi:hypothetical protein
MRANFEFAEADTRGVGFNFQVAPRCNPTKNKFLFFYFFGQSQSFDLGVFNQLLEKGLLKPLSTFSVKRLP